jgi:hypothetical protein
VRRRDASAIPSGTSSARAFAIRHRLALMPPLRIRSVRSFARDDPRFDAAGRPGERDPRVRPARQDLPRDGDARIQVPPVPLPAIDA